MRLSDGEALLLSVFIAAGFLLWAATQAPNWSKLTPQQQRILHSVEPHWNDLPPAQRQGLLDAAALYPKMSESQQHRFSRRLARWTTFAPEERANARATYLSFISLPEEERWDIENQWWLENYR